VHEGDPPLVALKIPEGHTVLTMPWDDWYHQEARDPRSPISDVFPRLFVGGSVP
jgi:hypothetical protein